MQYESAWKFSTARFCVELQINEDCSYQYDGDDADGETQRKLDNGDYIAFDSRVVVYCDGREVGANSLGGSVYDRRAVDEFWTAHRDRDPMNRNCTIMRRAYKGENNPDAKITICHYFPDMVRQAVADARKTLCNVPELRCA
jgi:hypothetical protein